jgi:hypothetical protein
MAMQISLRLLAMANLLCGRSRGSNVFGDRKQGIVCWDDLLCAYVVGDNIYTKRWCAIRPAFSSTNFGLFISIEFVPEIKPMDRLSF